MENRLKRQKKMWKIKEIALFLEKSAEKFCWFKKN